MMRLTVLAALLGSALITQAGEGDRPAPSVTYATSWAEAIDEARAVNVPIVVHRHGFY